MVYTGISKNKYMIDTLSTITNAVAAKLKEDDRSNVDEEVASLIKMCAVKLGKSGEFCNNSDAELASKLPIVKALRDSYINHCIIKFENSKSDKVRILSILACQFTKDEVNLYILPFNQVSIILILIDFYQMTFT